MYYVLFIHVVGRLRCPTTFHTLSKNGWTSCLPAYVGHYFINFYKTFEQLVMRRSMSVSVLNLAPAFFSVVFIEYWGFFPF